MGCGQKQAWDDDQEAAEREYQAMLSNLTNYQKNLIIASAWYVVRTFEDGTSTIHQQSASLELLKKHLETHTR
jgi:hypothetical protein